MSIIKIQVSVPEALKALKKFKENRLQALEELTSTVRSSVNEALNQLLNTEMELFLGQEDQTENKRNGYKTKDYALKGIGAIKVRVPQDRKNLFDSKIIPKSERIDPRIREDLAVLHLSGISNRVLSMISKRILGVNFSKDTVHQSLQLISERAISWLERPIEEKYWALYIDGTNFKIQRRRGTEKEPTLIVLGINDDDHRSILSMDPGIKDSAEAWRTVFHSLKERGLESENIRIGIMDGLPGLEKVFKEEFPNAVTARCWVHSIKNALNKCPNKLQDTFKHLIDKVMYSSSKNDAITAFNELKRQMGGDGMRAVSCIEKDLDSLLVHYTFDKKYWRALKTTNPIERVNKELKRRTKSMETVGENTLAVLQAFTALRLEMGWRTYRVDDKRCDPANFMKKKIDMVSEKLLN